jgi:branched-subunit amino acid aminotransferase/4-amino-4-deoxychorismate lyase
MLPFYSIDGVIIPSEEAKVRVNDLGLLRGYAIFDFFGVKNGVPVFLEDYIERFEKSAALMDLDLPFRGRELIKKIRELLVANGRENAYVRLLLTGGESVNGFSPEHPTLLMMEYEYELFNNFLPEGGIHLMLDQYVRDLPEVKTTNYARVIRLRSKLKKMGASDLLYHDGKIISESSRSNFFLFKPDGTLVTAERNILLGVTRKHLLKVARELFAVEVRDLLVEELKDARETFLSSTTKGVLPVLQIDGLVVGNGKPGKKCIDLLAAFTEYVNKHIAKYQTE